MIKSRKRVSSALLGSAIISGLVFSNVAQSNSADANLRLPAAGFFTRVSCDDSQRAMGATDVANC